MTNRKNLELPTGEIEPMIVDIGNISSHVVRVSKENLIYKCNPGVLGGKGDYGMGE